ncbi:hypothetical protein [Nocardioides sp. JQ2195]|uniref:hypothetical protein n=1 Tax=Nocardioides sp. JQ2195 TaxID=2592334 RepID=UPI00197E2BE8|nr:hypothetical protein [Nocardioides sp. JQ2195]
MDEPEVRRLQGLQAGVISRRQVLACGGNDNDIERLVRRREWARVLGGVYVDHTGPLSWEQRAWVAVLSHWPAALIGRSALDAHGVRRRSGLRSADAEIHIGIDATRTATVVEGIRVKRLRGFDTTVQWHLHPPRVRLEGALLQVAAEAADEASAVAVLADACQTRRTTAERLRGALAAIPRQRHRRLLLSILEDVACGAFSVMERLYLTGVERRHRLPAARRQRLVRSGRSVAHRDIDYEAWRLVVELDGRLGHEWSDDRWADLDRDVVSAVEDEMTLRVGWKQVLEPCRLAAAVARILVARGWDGKPRACGPGCPVGRLCVDVPASGAGTSTHGA